MGVLLTVEFAPTVLRCCGVQGVLRVSVGIAGQHFVRADAGGLVEADAERRFAFDALQDIHVVGDCRAGMAGAAEAIVPTGPGEFARWQQARVGVQHHVVVGVEQGAEDRTLGVARVGQ